MLLFPLLYYNLLTNTDMKGGKDNYDLLKLFAIGFGIASLGITLAIIGFVLTYK